MGASVFPSGLSKTMRREYLGTCTVERFDGTMLKRECAERTMAGQKTDERDLHLGRRLFEQRKRAKLTQREVAESFGMSAAQLQKYEKGVNRISAVHLAILSRLTGTPVAEFLDGLPLLDMVASPGFAEETQDTLTTRDPWTGLARVVARHVAETFDETSRRDFASAIGVLNRALNP